MAAKWLPAGRHQLGDLGDLVVVEGHEAMVLVVPLSKVLLDTAEYSEELQSLAGSIAERQAQTAVIQRRA